MQTPSPGHTMLFSTHSSTSIMTRKYNNLLNKLEVFFLIKTACHTRWVTLNMLKEWTLFRVDFAPWQFLTLYKKKKVNRITRFYDDTILQKNKTKQNKTKQNKTKTKQNKKINQSKTKNKNRPKTAKQKQKQNKNKNNKWQQKTNKQQTNKQIITFTYSTGCFLKPRQARTNITSLRIQTFSSGSTDLRYTTFVKICRYVGRIVKICKN